MTLKTETEEKKYGTFFSVVKFKKRNVGKKNQSDLYVKYSDVVYWIRTFKKEMWAESKIKSSRQINSDQFEIEEKLKEGKLRFSLKSYFF